MIVTDPFDLARWAVIPPDRGEDLLASSQLDAQPVRESGHQRLAELGDRSFQLGEVVFMDLEKASHSMLLSE